MEYLYEIHEENLNLYGRDNIIGKGTYSSYYKEKGKKVLSFLSQVKNQEGNLEKTLLDAINITIRRSGAIGKTLSKGFSKFKVKDINSNKIVELDISKLPNISIE